MFRIKPRKPVDNYDSERELAMIDQINAVRTAVDLEPFTIAEALTQSARRHSQDMALNEVTSTIGSDGTDGGRRIRDADYRWMHWGEVIAWGFSGEVDYVVELWQESASFRDVLYSERCREIGVGYVDSPGSKWGSYWTVDIATPMSGYYDTDDYETEDQPTENQPTVVNATGSDWRPQLVAEPRATGSEHTESGVYKSIKGFFQKVLP
jgi:hypothetical protein